MKKMILIIGIGLCFCACVKAQNLLRNGDLKSGLGRDVPGWAFSESIGLSEESVIAVREGKVMWGLMGNAGERFLSISIEKPTRAHIWWRQDVAAVGGLSYHLSFQASGTGKPHTRGESGVYFRNADGSWGKYLAIPQFNLTQDWKVYTIDFTAPDNAKSVTVRLGADDPGNDVIEVRFKNIVLTTQ